MTTINAENAKQIRKPMEVYVRMDLSDKSITMTYSGYSSAKIADGKLDKTDWKMRKLTDLQGDGYPLDSSCVLYNPNTTASASNGKIGVRGNIGQPVSVTITGSAVMDSATIIVTGASSVSNDGGTSTISGSTAIVSIEASTTTLTFTPKSADRRVEISDIMPGVMFNVTNENMISCTLSLRSDLSIIDPTLPESEMNLEFYNDEDISEILAAIPEDTPITYRAGYDGDLSPERKFYIADQVTYKDNVVSVHAVDAVHFLDVEMFAYGADIDGLDETDMTNLAQMIKKSILAFVPNARYDSDPSTYVYNRLNPHQFVFPRGNLRDNTAFCMNMFRYRDLSPSWSRNGNAANFIFDYVDAGIPSITLSERAKKWTITEDDCADIERNIERPLSGVHTTHTDTRIMFGWNSGMNYRDLLKDYAEVGTGTWLKGSGVFLNLNDYTGAFYVGIVHNGVMKGLVPATPDIMMQDFAEIPGCFVYAGKKFYYEVAGLMDSNTTQNEAWVYGEGDGHIYTQVIPWDIPYYHAGIEGQSQAWNWMVSNGYIQPDATQADVTLYGGKVSTEEQDISIDFGTYGDKVDITLLGMGRAYFTDENETVLVEAYPNMSLDALKDRSNKTGSFTWKGNPKMQPRDYFTFVKLDGTEIDCTIEQIDLEHVGGGTTAKITYREGIV